MADEKFSIDINRLDGYPSFDFLPNKFPPTHVDPKPKNALSCIENVLDGYPSFGINFSPSQVEPYPNKAFRCNTKVLDGYPSFGINFSPSQVEPYPKNAFRCSIIREGYPSITQKEFIMFGAFANTPQLREVVIPKSIKFIADFAFYNSAVKTVTISKDCTYSEHSFPEGCKIKFYD